MTILKGLLIIFGILVLALIAIKIVGVILPWLIPTLAIFIVLGAIAVAVIMFLDRKLPREKSILTRLLGKMDTAKQTMSRFIQASHPETHKSPNQNPIMVIGIILLIAGLVLSGVQLFLKEKVSIFGTSVGSVNKLPESYLYVGLAVAIIGVLFIVGDLIRGTSQQTTASTSTSSVSENTKDITTSSVSIPEQIEQLAKLKEQGILSEEEFEEKKKELMSRL